MIRVSSSAFLIVQIWHVIDHAVYQTGFGRLKDRFRG